MPQAIPLAIAAAATAFGAATAGVLGTVAFAGITYGVLASTAISIAGGVLSSQLNKPKRPQALAPNVSVRQGTPVLPDVYGRCRIGGFFALYHAGEAPGSPVDLHTVSILAAHEIDAVEAIYDGDKLLWSSESGIVAEHAAFMVVEVRLGAPGQTPPTALLTGLGATLAGATGTNFLAEGRPYVYINFGNIRTHWGGQPPSSLWFLVRGKKLYDPRTELTSWSDNIALIARDYIVRRGGLMQSFIDDDSFIAAANLADEDVALNGGGTHKRYRFNGAIASDVPARDFLPEMLRYGLGKLVWSGAELGLQLGAYSAPVATYGPDDYREPISISGETLVEERWDRVEGVFTDPSAGWNPVGYASLTLDTYDPELGDPRVLTLDLTRETDHERAQRTANLTLLQSLRHRRIQTALPLNEQTVALLPGQRVTLILDEIGLSGVFEVVSRRSVYDPQNPRVQIDVIEDGPGFWSWSSDTATAAPPSLGSNLPDPLFQGAPTGLTVTAQTRVEPDGSISRWLDVSWSAPSESRYLDYYEVQWVQDGVIRTRRTSALTTRIEDVGAETGVTVSVVAVNTLGIRSTTVTAGAVTPGGDVTPPSVPPYGSIYPRASGFRFVMGNPTEADFAGFRLYRGAADVPFSSTVAISDHPATPGGSDTVFFDDGLVGATVYRYFVTAFDHTGNQSAAFGPLQASTPDELTQAEIDAAILSAVAVAENAQSTASAALAASAATDVVVEGVESVLASRGANRIPNSTFEAGLTGFQISNAGQPQPTTISLIPAGSDWAFRNAPTIQVLEADAGDPQGAGPHYTDAAPTVVFPSSPGQTWEASALVSAHNTICAIFVAFFAADGTILTGTNGTDPGSFNNSAVGSISDPYLWPRLYQRLTAPVGTAYGIWTLRKFSNVSIGSPIGYSAMFFAEPQMLRVAPGTTGPASPYVPGPDTAYTDNVRAFFNRSAAALAADDVSYAQTIQDQGTTLGAQDARITSVETTTSSQSGSIAALQTTVSAQAGEIDALEGSVTTLASVQAGINGQLTAYYGIAVDGGGNGAFVRLIDGVGAPSVIALTADDISLNGNVVINGTLSGTALVDLAIANEKLANLSASNSAIASGSGGVLPSDIVDFALMNLNFTSLGRDCFIAWSSSATTGGFFGGQLIFRLKRGTTLLKEVILDPPLTFTNVAFNWAGFVPAGLHTFSLQVSTPLAGATGHFNLELFLLELRSQR